MNAIEWLVYAAAWQAWCMPRWGRDFAGRDALALVLSEGDRRLGE